ncbi:protein of unknown function [Methylocella tundrae]|uniref:HTH lysR-type domain-containing protein n=1 Tax=Methylocella tundrae TaxID=227605 RepID=A0A4U8Z1U7_METTU|nr:protein of unknown function [Methylocella tundrae]
MPRVLPGEIDTLLALRANGKLLVGRERVTLLEAVIQHGSITKAADVAGFSYKTAWDAVNAINNLLPRPAFITHTGGPRGGGAEVTEEGAPPARHIPPPRRKAQPDLLQHRRARH